MNISYLTEALAPFPFLLWDTAFPVDELTENRPYRNIGDLLVKRSPFNRSALRLCGCDTAITDGQASDYECFAALCLATPMLAGHRAALATREILQHVFSWENALSSYTIEDDWIMLNTAIESRNLRPSDVAQALQIESLCYRHPVLSPLPKTDFPGVDLYPIWDLQNPIYMFSRPSRFYLDMEDLVKDLEASLSAFLSAGCVSVRLALPKTYTFSRNGRKREIDNLLYKIQNKETLTSDEQNQWITSLLISLAALWKQRNLVLLLETVAEEEELNRLYDYLAMNRIIPETVWIAPSASVCSHILRRHTFRTAKGLPSLLPVTDPISMLARDFPIGSTMVPSGDIYDIVSLAEGCRHRKLLIQALADLEAPPDILSSLAEDVAYGNIKNRFGI